MTLTDPVLSSIAKAAIVGDLLGSKVDAITLDLIKYVAGHLRGRRVDSVLATLGNLAAAQRNQVVAEVRSVVALDAEQTRKYLQHYQNSQVKMFGLMSPLIHQFWVG